MFTHKNVPGQGKSFLIGTQKAPYVTAVDEIQQLFGPGSRGMWLT